jgi:hypothetical protein
MKLRQPLQIPNKFQALIESPDIRLYSIAERASKSVALSSEDIKDHLLPRLLEAANEHVDNRKSCIEKKVFGIPVEQKITEVLFDTHFRKQKNYGPTRTTVQAKVGTAISKQEPIHLVSLMFTRKNTCLLKSYGDISMPDLAEIISLIHLNSFAKLISKFHPYGARFTILSEGVRFLKAFDLDEQKVRLYQSRLKEWASVLSLTHLDIQDYEDFLSERLRPDSSRARTAAYKDAIAKYETLMLPLLDADDMTETLSKAVQNDPVRDFYNPRSNFVPLWDSIKHSLPYPEVYDVANELGVEYESLYRKIFSTLLVKQPDQRLEHLRCEVLRKSWAAAIEHNARILGDAISGIDVASLVSTSAFRTTINPKPDSQHLGIYSVRETTSRVQPWHGMAYIELDGVGRLKTTVLTKLELESKGARPILVGESSNAFFYASPQAADLMESKSFPTANMSTR